MWIERSDGSVATVRTAVHRARAAEFRTFGGAWREFRTWMWLFRLVLGLDARSRFVVSLYVLCTIV